MLRCLLVDDDDFSREMLALQLEPYAVCDMAVDGNEAVEKFRQSIADANPYNAIFLDILMPGLDGHGAAKAIRHIEAEHGIPVEKGISIIVLSSLSAPQDVIQAYVSAQSAAHLFKPLNPLKLLKILRKLELIPEDKG